MLQKLNDRRSEKGSVMVEFLFCSLIWLPLLLGTIVFGINIIEALRVSQLSRDTGHMYAYGVDFSQPQNQALLTRLASVLQIRPRSGSGAVVLSTVTLVTDADCLAVSPCTNRGKYVFTNLLVFGNSQYAKTTLGSPNLSRIEGGYILQASDYLNDIDLRANNFESLLKFQPNVPGQLAFISEVFVNSQAIKWSDFSDTGSSARSIF